MTRNRDHDTVSDQLGTKPEVDEDEARGAARVTCRWARDAGLGNGEAAELLRMLGVVDVLTGESP